MSPLSKIILASGSSVHLLRQLFCHAPETTLPQRVQPHVLAGRRQLHRPRAKILFIPIAQPYQPPNNTKLPTPPPHKALHNARKQDVFHHQTNQTNHPNPKHHLLHHENNRHTHPLPQILAQSRFETLLAPPPPSDQKATHTPRNLSSLFVGPIFLRWTFPVACCTPLLINVRRRVLLAERAYYILVIYNSLGD